MKIIFLFFLSFAIKANNLNFEVHLHKSYKNDFLLKVFKDSKKKLEDFSELLIEKNLSKNWEKFQRIENVKNNVQIFKKHFFYENKIVYKNLGPNLIEIFNIYEKKGKYYILCVFKKKLLLFNKRFEKVHEIFLDFEVLKSMVKIEEYQNFLFFISSDLKIKKYIFKISLKRKILDFVKKEEKDLKNEIDENYEIFSNRNFLILKNNKKNLILDLKFKKITNFETEINYKIYKFHNMVYFCKLKR